MSDYLDLESAQMFEEALHDAMYERRLLGGKHEIAEYYERTHGSRWRSIFTDDALSFLGLENNKKNRNTISRDVQGSRLDVVSKKGAAKQRYDEIARALGPVDVPRDIKGKHLRIRVEVWIKVSGEKIPRVRRFTVVLSPEEAEELIENMSLDLAFEAYGINPDEIEEASGLSITMDFF